MRVNLFVVSRAQVDCDCAGRLKERAIPRDTLGKLKEFGVTVKIRALLLKGTDYNDIARSILDLTPELDDVCVLTIGNTGSLHEVITPHILCQSTDDSIQKNPQNALGSAYTNLLRKYLRVREKYQNLGQRKIMMLPRRNCHSQELHEFLALSGYSGTHGAFSGEVDRLLAALRSRMKPKKKTSAPISYFVDDEAQHFQLGHEQHALASDACPPHKTSCVLGVHFRMGMRLNRQDHYNVTIDGDFISGAFVDCHDMPALISARTHLNIFPNGQF